MEQNLNIFSPILQTGNAGKGNAAPASLQNSQSLAMFGELVQEASQDNNPQEQVSGVGGKQSATDDLEQQLLELSTSVEDKLALAADENASPEAVEEILADSVLQLWSLLDAFDAQNGTELVSGLAESLQQAGLDTEGALTTQAEALLDPSGIPVVTPVQPASPVLSVISLTGQSQTPAIAALPAPVQYVASRPVNSQFGQGSLFARIIELAKEAEAPGNSVQQQLNFATDRNLKPAVNLPQGLQDASGMLRGPVSPLPENIQQFAMGMPVKQSTPVASIFMSENKASNNTNALVSPMIAGGGGEVAAKVKELLVVSAKAIASGKEPGAALGENGGLFNNQKADFSPPVTAAKPEQPAAASSFSKNIANQIQEVTLSPGRTRIELAPRGLGSVVIDIHPKDSGGLQVVLRAENPAVLHALRTDREALLAVISNSDVQQENVSLNFQSFGQSGFSHGEEDNEGSGLNAGQNEVEGDPDIIANRVAGLGQLDFFT